MFNPIPENKGWKGGERLALIILAILIVGAIIYYYSNSLQKISELEKKLEETSVLLAGIEKALKSEGIEISVNKESSETQEKQFSRETQEIGEDISGVLITGIRTWDHGNFFRLVFDITNSQNKIPKARSALVGGEQRIVLEISGISKDIDLQTAFIGNTLNFQDKVVKAISGKFLSDKEGKVQYEITLSQDSAFRLQGLTDPPRIVLDIEK